MKYQKDYYQILGVKPDATLAEIKQAYHRLAMLNHPDKDPSYLATARMQEINEAYSVLRDGNKRIQYDIEHRNLIAAVQTKPPKDDKRDTVKRKPLRFFATGIEISPRVLSSIGIAFLAILSSLAIASGFILLGLTHGSINNSTSASSVFATVTPGSLRQPVCASYIQLRDSNISFQGMWSDKVEATQSWQACYTWMKNKILYREDCGAPGATSIKIVFIEKSRHYHEMPSDLNFNTEVLAQKQCSTQ